MNYIYENASTYNKWVEKEKSLWIKNNWEDFSNTDIEQLFFDFTLEEIKDEYNVPEELENENQIKEWLEQNVFNFEYYNHYRESWEDIAENEILNEVDEKYQNLLNIFNDCCWAVCKKINSKLIDGIEIDYEINYSHSWNAGRWPSQYAIFTFKIDYNKITDSDIVEDLESFECDIRFSDAHYNGQDYDFEVDWTDYLRDVDESKDEWIEEIYNQICNCIDYKICDSEIIFIEDNISEKINNQINYLLNESKQDIDAFINKFGQDTYEEFKKSTQRLKNANYSTDIIKYTKDDSWTKEKLDKLLFNLSNKLTVNKDDSTKIEGKYRDLGIQGNYHIYEPLDALASMNLGVGSGWCTTGRYGHYGDKNFKPSLKDAENHWDNYTSKGIRFFYYLDKNTNLAKYAIALYPETIDVDRKIGTAYVTEANFEIYNAEDELDYDAFNKLPTDNLGVKLILEAELILDNNIIYTVENNIKTKFAEIKDDTLYVENGVKKIVCLEDILSQDILNKIKNIDLPDGVKEIDRFAFLNCASLESITIPDSVEKIGNTAFSHCRSLKSVTIPNSVTTIGNYIFSDCSSLTSIYIPSSVTSIGNYVFDSCSNLTTVIIGENSQLTSIGDGAFSYCDSLTSIYIPSGVTTIGDYAFEDCSSLTSIYIPNSVTLMGSYVFSGCSNLTIYCEAESQPKVWWKNWNWHNRPVVWGYKNYIKEDITKEQEDYFKDSKIRDKEGNLLICYHGTKTPGFDEFNHTGGNSQFGNYKFGKYNVNFFSTNKEIAKGYTDIGVERNNNIYYCYLNIINPYIVNNETKEDVENFVLQRWNNIKDKTIRNRQIEKFKAFWKKWGNKKLNKKDIIKVNQDLAIFNAALISSLEREQDNSGYIKDENYYDLVTLGENTLYGKKHILMYSYGLDEIFDIDNYEEIRDNLVGDIDSMPDDYYLTTNDIVRFVINMNEEKGTNYDGIIIPDIYDIGPTGSLFTDKTTDIITLKSSNQIKRIDNLKPTSSNKINEESELKENLFTNNNIISLLSNTFGTTDEPEATAMYILPNGRFLFTTPLEPSDDCNYEIEEHRNIDDFLYHKGIVKEDRYLKDDGSLFAENVLNFIRFNIVDEYYGYYSYIQLNKKQPTSQQYNALLKIFDYVINNKYEYLSIIFDSQYGKQIKLKLNDYTGDELLKKIKRYYVSGILTENKNNSREYLFKNLNKEDLKEINKDLEKEIGIGNFCYCPEIDLSEKDFLFQYDNTKDKNGFLQDLYILLKIANEKNEAEEEEIIKEKINLILNKQLKNNIKSISNVSVKQKKKKDTNLIANKNLAYENLNKDSKKHDTQLKESKLIKGRTFSNGCQYGPVFVTDSPYEMKNILKSSKEALRILYDKKKKFYIYGNIDDYIHRDLLRLAWGYMLYPEFKHYWEITEGYFETNTYQLIFSPTNKIEDVYGTKIGEDNYTNKIVYDFGVITGRDMDDEGELDFLYEIPLIQILKDEEIESSYQDGWVDDYTPRIINNKNIDTTNKNNYNKVKEDMSMEKETHLKDILDKKHIDAIYVYNDIRDVHFFSDENLDEDIEKHDTLNPLLFDEDDELKPEIKETIEKIVNQFVEELKTNDVKIEVKDIILVGSNVSYNYTKDSDLDIHIIADKESIKGNLELYTLLYGAYRTIFNKNYDITIKGIPVEIYVELE